MSLFKTMTSIICDEYDDVIETLEEIIKINGGVFQEVTNDYSSNDVGIVTGYNNHITIIYPKNFAFGEACTIALTKKMGTLGFMFHTNIDDLWMYVCYENGKEIDKFNPLFEYMDGDKKEIEQWKGNPELISNKFDVDFIDIKKYYKAEHMDFSEYKEMYLTENSLEAFMQTLNFNLPKQDKYIKKIIMSFPNINF